MDTLSVLIFASATLLSVFSAWLGRRSWMLFTDKDREARFLSRTDGRPEESREPEEAFDEWYMRNVMKKIWGDIQEFPELQPMKNGHFREAPAGLSKK